MVELSRAKSTKTTPIIVVVVVLILLALGGYSVYVILSEDTPDPVASGESLNVEVLESDALRLIQYDAGEAPAVANSDIGRQDPFAPF